MSRQGYPYTEEQDKLIVRDIDKGLSLATVARSLGKDFTRGMVANRYRLLKGTPRSTAVRAGRAQYLATLTRSAFVA